jgi:hypothetical protein
MNLSPSIENDFQMNFLKVEYLKFHTLSTSQTAQIKKWIIEIVTQIY